MTPCKPIHPSQSNRSRSVHSPCNQCISKPLQSWNMYMDTILQTKLWSGERITLGPTTELYLRLAEAYSIYNALSFLSNYLNWFPMMLAKWNCSVHVLQQSRHYQVTKNQQTFPSNPNNMVSDDHGICKAILQLWKVIILLSVWFIHVLGHQDKEDQKTSTNQKQN